MARKRGVDPYPLADSLARTLHRDDVALTGARQFFASEGIAVFAAEKEGIAAVAGETWLRPSAYRRISHYLDLRDNPAVCGYRISRRPSRGQMTAIEGDLFEQFKVAAQRTKGKTLDEDRQIRFGCADDSHGGWPWSVAVRYQNVLKLADGQRIFGDATVELFVRPGSDETIDIAVVILRKTDLEAALVWLNHTASSIGQWEVSPISMNEDVIFDELERIQGALGQGRSSVLAWASPQYDRTVGVDDDTDDAFVAGLRGAKYDTEWYADLATVKQRADLNAAAVTQLQAIVHEQHERIGRTKDAPEPVVGLQIAQRITAAHLFLNWQSGRLLPADLREVSLTRSAWEKLPRLDWDADKKRDYVLGRWARVIDALDAGEAQAQAQTA